MKPFFVLLILILISFNAMGQNEHPMRISMVSVFVEDTVITFSSNDILKTVAELKKKGVKFRKDPVKTDYGYEGIFEVYYRI